MTGRSTTATVEFDDFSGGEFGLKGAHKAAPNEWTGKNVRVNQAGMIGPRPGLLDHTITGNEPGDLWAFKYIGLSGKAMLLCLGDTIYSTDTDTATMTLSSLVALDDVPTEHVPIDFYDPNADLYLSNPGFKTYTLTWSSGTLTEFMIESASHGFRGVKLYRDRLYLFDDATTNEPSYRVYFSDAAAFATFTDGKNFDVGYFWDIYAAIDLANHLYFPQRQKGWYALIGGSPDTIELRQLTTDPPELAVSAGSSQQAFVKEHGQIWYFRSGGRLCVTNGAAFDEKAYGHLELGPVSPHRFGLYLEHEGQDIVFKDDLSTEALWRHWGVWCFADFSVDLDGQMATTEFNNRVIFAGAGDSDTAHALYSFDLALDRPGFIGDDYARPGDASDTPLDAFFFLPEWRDKQDRDFRVAQVIVDLVKYDWHGDSEATLNNHVKIELRTLNRANRAAGAQDNYEVDTQEWTEDCRFGATEGANGIDDRIRFTHPTEQWCGAFQLGLTELVGVNIKKVSVVLDYHPGRDQR